ncbi:hypothetical protein [Hydrotalea sandarakina]|jgi:hypothetical protein|uniref:Uncharacterized protein n=1 Tax=Hydrotalea sandarakina TaxID=1004304 RepID=A0A2W7RRY5_9BACT|nr:hypothetical protein [Hydrotalea sandarakina]PZX63443.1 hypothetical protein LX80_01087 [Hydrotalea sandarakina]
MKFVISILITALLSFAFSLYAAFPWYTFAICAFVVALAIHQKPYKAFLAAFIALFLLWGIWAFLIDAANNHILSKKVAEILPLHGSSIAIILVTALVGGIVAGMAALTGSLIRKI